MFKGFKKEEEKGFTIIELMVVLAIIAILASIGITQFAFYKTRSYNAAAVNDLRNFKTALEAYYTENNRYPNL